MGQIVPLFKKRDRNTKDDYRGVCLLAMGSRILGRVLASRLRRWSEAMGLTDENQCGFRPGWSTADATQIMVRMEEGAEDLRKRRRRREEEEEREDDPVARLCFLGGCLHVAEVGALGVRPDASKRHQGPGGPYTRHSKECRDDMPRGTTECPRCSRPGDLLKQKGGNSTPGFPPRRGWGMVGSWASRSWG